MQFELSMTEEAENQLSVIMNDAAKKGLQKQVKKALGFLSQNPNHPGLRTHLMSSFEKVYGVKVLTSYVQNKTANAYRILWSYGKQKGTIVVLAVIPHY